QDLLGQIDSMRERIRRDRGSGSELLDFKTGRGGMVEAEFLVQGLQMRAGIWGPHFASAVNELSQHGILSPTDVAALQSSYDLLRRCESILRRRENKAVSSLPTDEKEQETLARFLGAKNLAAFGEQYRAARETIHAIYARFFD
ncbi:MAG: hypothetical protein M3119_11995, partial [Verrucomicrobiota bacterium]|nr:hypothetical protein [Verrucomicrobiota bacterium]